MNMSILVEYLSELSEILPHKISRSQEAADTTVRCQRSIARAYSKSSTCTPRPARIHYLIKLNFELYKLRTANAAKSKYTTRLETIITTMLCHAMQNEKFQTRASGQLSNHATRDSVPGAATNFDREIKQKIVFFVHF